MMVTAAATGTKHEIDEIVEEGEYLLHGSAELLGE